jgi:uncharacterized membrane protein (DUF106 family)
MKNVLKKYWKEISLGLVFLIMSVTIVVLFNKPQVTVTIEDTKRIERLRDSVDVLNKQMDELRVAYNNKQGEVITKIKYIKEENAKEISNLGKLNLVQRDSVWSSFEAP